jgi:hypothetical protein
MPTTVNGLPVPLDTDPIASGAQNMRDLAGKLQPVSSGIVSLNFNNVSAVNAAITFPAGRFTTAPTVTAGAAGSSAYYGYSATTPTTSGATVGLAQRDGQLVTQTPNCHWQAMGVG